LFEAIVNSIHGIEEAGNQSDKGRITIEIIRKDKQSLLELDSTAKKRRGPDTHEDITGFKITDNGIGFTDENMKSFETLDSDYKAKKGCRGVGRLLWLKAFERVHVHSVYNSQSRFFKREFGFLSSGVTNSRISEANTTENSTTIHLDGFRQRYRDNSRKTLDSIADCIFEHCLWYFIRPGGAPEIFVFDDGESRSLDELYENRMLSAASRDSLEINSITFDLLHIKLRSNSLSTHAIALCANNRLVTEEKIAGKIPGLFGRIQDSNGGFVYECYVSSNYLDDTARPERTGFDITDSVDVLFEKSEISLSQIRQAVIDKASIYLKDFLVDSGKRSRDRIDKFIETRAPRYRPIIARIPDSKLNVDPSISEKELDLTLHRCLAEFEEELLSDGHDILKPKATESMADYHKRVDVYLSKVTDLKKSDLANYVSHRRVIIDFLADAIKKDAHGKYTREDIIHNLVMPMQMTSNQVSLDDCNLWLIDERLAFHNYLASDKTLRSMPITSCKDTKEPDMCALHAYDNPILVSEGQKLPLASIVIIEIKRPMRNNAAPGEEHDPVEQAIGYLNRIRKGQVQTPQGRPIPDSNDIPGFCYILADITPSFKERCEYHHDLKPTYDHMGYFGYKANSKAYIEVISFEKLVNSARERNRAFFDRLGLPNS
jgi:hypothetical protein